MIRDTDALNERANDLLDAGFNGLERVIVHLAPEAVPPFAELEVHLHNTLHRDSLVAAGNTPARAAALFPIRGGLRIRAGSALGQVGTTAVSAGPTADSIALRVEPIGDYSTYTLTLDADSIDPVLGIDPPVAIDPFFSDLPFKFRPGCFTNDCAPEWDPAPPRVPSPAIDYLAKDYQSFRHTMMTAMAQRVPGWEATSEADLDQVVIDLVSAAADELSDHQDRVMSEAYLATCRKRVSLARHARLMDYHIHQGNQASTWVALDVDPSAGEVTLPADHPFWTGTQVLPGYEHRVHGAVLFATRESAVLHPIANTLRLYTWDDAVPALAAGSTTADLAVDTTGLGLTEEQGAQFVVDRIREMNPAQPRLRRLLLQQWLNPLTGTENGRDPRRRQMLELVEGEAGAELIEDTVRGRFLVRVRWRPEDQLRRDFEFTVFPGGLRVPDVSRFHGNLVRAHHGEPRIAVFREPGSELAPDDPAVPTQPLERHFQRTAANRHGVLCVLPHAPLAHVPTPPGGEVAPRTTLRVEVEIPGGGNDPWDEVISLVHSDDSEENGDHFAVETDEQQRSVLRFGNGTNGRLLPDGSTITCRYQVGQGTGGNIGSDTLTNAAPIPALDPGTLRGCWNPFDVEDGREPEPVEKIVRNAPEAYRARQLRAVTTEDYVRRAEEVPGVSRAAATYRWTGSWRTVRVAVDPEGATALTPELRAAVAGHLEAVRLIGEDLEIRPPRFVPLAILVAVCIDPEFWTEDIKHVLEQEFSAGYTPDGRPGFFHPDAWTFGQRIHRSQVHGRIQQVRGVDHVMGFFWRRFNEPTPGMYGSPTTGPDELFVGPDEIIQVLNDPDQMERGFIRFFLQGGRR